MPALADQRQHRHLLRWLQALKDGQEEVCRQPIDGFPSRCIWLQGTRYRPSVFERHTASGLELLLHCHDQSPQLASFCRCMGRVLTPASGPLISRIPGEEKGLLIISGSRPIGGRPSCPSLLQRVQSLSNVL